MNDSKNNPKPLPPDDFSATTPNIKVPKQSLPNYQNDSANDWEKTNYNYSAKDMPEEVWKKTAYNTPPAQSPPQDFNKTYLPNQPSSSQKNDDWGATKANIDLPYDAPSNRDNYGSKQSEYGATTPFINLPEREREKYNVPSSATSFPQIAIEPEKIADTKKEETKSGIPGWLMAAGGMLFMFLFAVAVLLGVYYLFLGKKGYDIALKNVPKNSEVFVNGSPWGMTSADDTIRLLGLKANEDKLIQVKGCIDKTIKGQDGDAPHEVTLSCDAKAPTTPTTPTNVPDLCKSIKNGDFATAAKCANDALDKLGETFTAQQLLDAMNLYIVNFAVNDYKIRTSDLAFLQKASGYIKRLEKLEPNTKIEVGGHTDIDGTDAKNQPLSENRAKAVRESLLGFGVNAAMLETRGYGSKSPKPGNQNRNPDEKFQNRRIEYKAILK